MGQAEFKNLRVLLVGSRTHMLSLLRTVLSVAGVTRVVRMEQPDRALDLLRQERFAAVFCDTLALRGGMPFAVAARRAPAVLNPTIPLFVLHERARRRDVERARDLGATDVLTVPISPRTVSLKLKAALKAPRPFILAPPFFGPDRRVQDSKPPAGPERRMRPVRKARANLTLA
jgi:PleD family two-component response regulator